MSDYASGQPETRRFRQFRDQHGRAWRGTISIKTGLPAGPISPHGWRAPLVVPSIYIRYNSLEPSNIRIDYDQWVLDIEKAKAAWDQMLLKAAQSMYGEQAGKVLRSRPRELMDAVGPEPPPTQPVLAALSGNKWVLGLDPVKPNWAKEFFPDEPAPETKRPSARADLSGQFPNAEDEE